MKRTRIMGLGLIAVCAIFAFTATSAFAVVEEGKLEFGKCTKVAVGSGFYKNAGCTKKATTTESKKFDWAPLSSAVKFTSKKLSGSGAPVLESVKEIEITCAEQKQEKEGEYGPGRYEVKNVVGEFGPGCEGLGGKCKSGSLPEGFINTEKLHGEPGTITKVAKEEKNEDGSDLRGQGTEFLAQFECAGLPVKVKRGIVVAAKGETGKLTTNKMLNKATIFFVANKPGKQVPEKWIPGGHGISHTAAEHKPTEPIEEYLEASFAGGAFEKSGQSLTTVQTTSPKTVKVELRQCEKGENGGCQ